MDLARNCIEHAEKNLFHTFDKLSKRDTVGSPVVPHSPDVTAANNEVSMTPLQQEFRRRMRGALLNLPLEDVNHRIHSPVRNDTRDSGESILHPTSQSITTSSMMENRENISSIVYAQLPEEESRPNNTTTSRRMLSFQGMSRDTSSFRSSSSSLTRDDSASDVLSNCCGMPSTPQRRLHRQFSNSCPSPHPHKAPTDPFSHDQLHVLHRLASSSSSDLSLTETRLRSVTKSIGRRIPKTPSRILDAPELVDDYYLNLVSWGENNVLAVALGQCVYLWEAETGNIRHLLTLRNDDDFVTSVSWASMRGNTNYIAVGTNHNAVQL